MEALQQQINELQQQLNLLKASGTLPYEVGIAVKERLNIPDSFLSGGASSTSPATHTQTVNEAGSSVYDVAKVMTGFVSITINGTAYNIAYY